VTWRRLLPAALVAGAALAAGCAQTGPMYRWDDYPRLQYEALLRAGATPLEQIGPMEAIADKARAGAQPLPPGFRAHLGLLKLAAGDAAQARSLWLAEKQAFPESAPFMDQLLGRLDPAPKKKDTPA